ncbi:hypothetical protein NA57DRAFT_70204 [Rhizodiscina lignyota]|uniref:DUF676 domain-containing protein n=1 Tax=Rhizodiscina lignyota TaxID=1504668 RepID=A0A9P4ME04_9PEZI|nr:hypothetical protein NA57DRAFT_70204 [Rhizodiscina lignyota]
MPASKRLPYTSDPLLLLVADVWLFLVLSFTWPITAGLLSIVLPLKSRGSGDLDELAFTWRNIWASSLHFVLFAAQTVFIIGVPLSAVFPLTSVPVWLAIIILFMTGNAYFCGLLNGKPGYIYGAGGEYASNNKEPVDKWSSKFPKHKGERWVFINGVAVGSHWMRSNLERLARTFHRPILGIHNRTYGIPFDVMECILQRTFGYATLDIRTAYKTISALLEDDEVKKLVLIAHSQGAIEASMVLDALYATIPQSKTAKLEIFTFGNASNHWNCPFDNSKHRVIKHIEHYANKGDWVARFGILHFRPRAGVAALTNPPSNEVVDVPASMRSNGSRTPVDSTAVTKESTFEIENERHGKHRFVGRLFLRDASGHQLNQHYLDNIFPLKADLTGVMDIEDCDFMNARFSAHILAMDDTVELIFEERVSQRTNGTRVENGTNESRLKDECRLWKYVNGQVPEDWIPVA